MLPEFLAQLPGRFRVYLARHAMPDRSRIDIPYNIPPGPPLTPRGLEEARELGEYLLSTRVPLIQTSPFERTLRTATIAAAGTSASLEINEDLGEWRADEIEKDVASRMRRAMLEAARISARGEMPVALVTHGGPVLALLKVIGVPAEPLDRCRIYDHRTPLPTAGAWLVERAGDELRVELAFIPQGYSYPAAGMPRFTIPLPMPLPFAREELSAD